MKVFAVVLALSTGCNLGVAVEIDLVGTGHGTVLSTPAGMTCGATTCEMTVESRPTLLTAKPDAASRFVGWSGYCTGAGDCRVLSTHDIALEARFDIASQFELRIDKIGSGRVVSTEPGIDCGATCSVLALPGSTLGLDAFDEPGWAFESWGAACVIQPPGRRCIVTMTQDLVVSVRFVAARTVTVVHEGTGTGLVTSMPDGINCGPTCAATFHPSTTSVLLRHTPGPGSVFVGWTNCPLVLPMGCHIEPVSDQTVTARFDLAP